MGVSARPLSLYFISQGGILTAVSRIFTRKVLACVQGNRYIYATSAVAVESCACAGVCVDRRGRLET